MTRRIKKSNDFELSLQIHNDQFIRPPRDAQRNWLLNRVMQEVSDELQHLDHAASCFVAGQDASFEDSKQGVLRDEEIMEDWQIPLMRVMAEIAGECHGDVLEVGFGRGISATFLQEVGVKSHTIVECNDSVVARFEAWKQDYQQSDIRLLHGRWQDVRDQFGEYDGILFHTYPMSIDEYVEHVARSVTYSQHFVPTAAKHLRNGGNLTYLTNEVDSLSREHQRMILRDFDSFCLRIVSGLEVPADTHDAHWSNSMAVIKVVK